MNKIALEVPSRDLRSVGEFHLYAGIVSGMSISIFRVELVPFILHDLILRFSIAFHEPLRLCSRPVQSTPEGFLLQSVAFA